MPFNPALPPSHRPPPPRYVPPLMSQQGQIRPSISMPATYWGHDPSDNCKFFIECLINGTHISRELVDFELILFLRFCIAVNCIPYIEMLKYCGSSGLSQKINVEG